MTDQIKKPCKLETCIYAVRSIPAVLNKLSDGDFSELHLHAVGSELWALCESMKDDVKEGQKVIRQAKKSCHEVAHSLNPNPVEDMKLAELNSKVNSMAPEDLK